MVPLPATKSGSSFVFRPVVEDERSHRRDRALLGSLAAGKSEALGELYDHHAASLFRHAMVLTGRRADAEDLVQAVFVKLATTGAELLGVRTPVSYLHRILRTTWIDGQRRRAAGARVAALEAPHETAWLGWRHHSTADGIDVIRALEGLPVVQREVIVLHLVEGFSFREIGGLTGVSLFTAAGRYRAAIGHLRRVLGHTKEITHEAG